MSGEYCTALALRMVEILRALVCVFGCARCAACGGVVCFSGADTCACEYVCVMVVNMCMGSPINVRACVVLSFVAGVVFERLGVH